MLFKIIKDQTMLESNPEMESIEQFKAITDREMKWICLVYDYKSPLRQLPMEKRKEKAAILAGYGLDKKTGKLNRRALDVTSDKSRKQTVSDAVKEFLTLQYDLEQETLRGYDNYLQEVVEFLQKKDKDEKERKEALTMAKELPKLTSARKTLLESLQFREDTIADQLAEEEDSTIDDRNLSRIDRVNQQYANE